MELWGVVMLWKLQHFAIDKFSKLLQIYVKSHLEEITMAPKLCEMDKFSNGGFDSILCPELILQSKY